MVFKRHFVKTIRCYLAFSFHIMPIISAKRRVSAISATARKLAVIIWNMVVKNVPYHNPEGYLFLDQKRKLGMVKRIQKQIDKFGISKEDVVFS